MHSFSSFLTNHNYNQEIQIKKKNSKTPTNNDQQYEGKIENANKLNQLANQDI